MPSTRSWPTHPLPVDGRAPASRGRGFGAGRRGGRAAALPPPRLAPPRERRRRRPPDRRRRCWPRRCRRQEGRQHLRGAMELLREQDRQDRLVRNAEQEVEREQRYRDRLVKVLSLPAHEQEKVGQFYGTLQAGRRKVLEEMRVRPEERRAGRRRDRQPGGRHRAAGARVAGRAADAAAARRPADRARGAGAGPAGQQGQPGGPQSAARCAPPAAPPT